MSSHRIERDSLGEKKVPADAYFGVQTQRAVENFPVSGKPTHIAMVRAYQQQKKASCRAHKKLGTMKAKIADAILQAADEALEGAFDAHYVVDQFQAGAGTSFNMNSNEVFANRAQEILGGERGTYTMVHPNDHVNKSQSTNDTFPTALHVSTLMRHGDLDKAIGTLERSLLRKGKEFHHVVKSGRTHCQDAVPITLGQEFTGYGLTLRRCREQLNDAADGLREIALGGSAVGTGMNCPKGYKALAVRYLAQQTGLKLRVAKDLRERFQSHRPMGTYSAALRALALELTRISNDLRLLSSGPLTGFAEITLPAVQPGSSIMPGKVNPVMAECLNMVMFKILGNDHCIAMAVQAGQMELNVMMPVMAQAVHESIDLLVNYLPQFARACIDGIVADEERCRHYYETSPSLATVLNPVIGYARAAEIAKESVRTGKTVRQIAMKKKIVSKRKLDALLDPITLTEGPDAKRRRKR